MRLFSIVLLSAMIVTACTPAPLRTGSLVINKFGIEDYKNPNPVAIRKDVAESLRDGLYRELLTKIKEDSKLNIAQDCSTADYELTGRFERINSKIDSHYRLVLVTVNHQFEVEVEGLLRRCRSGEVVTDFSASEEKEDMENLIEKLADSIVKDIRKDATLIPAVNQ